MSASKFIAYSVVVALVASLAVHYVWAIAPAREHEMVASCQALHPTEFHPRFKFPAPAPDFTAPYGKAQTQQTKLSAYRGSVVFLNFWASWCPPCVDEMPAMERLQHSLKDENFVVLAPSSDKNWDDIRGFFKSGTNLTVLHDLPGADSDTIGERARLYGTTKLPETYVIDKQGNIRYYFVNKRDWNSSLARQCMRSLLEE